MIIKKPKPKKCGNKECPNRFVPTRPFQKGCCIECSVIIGMEAIKKSKAKQAASDRKAKAEEKRADKERLEVLKTRAQWIRETQIAFNAFIRYRDMLAGHLCISSGRQLDWNGNAVDAGHYRSTGSAPHLRFDERNCHAQSKMDNRYLSGNAVDYRIGLIARIGLQAVEELEADQEPRKHSIDQLKQIKALYVTKLKELKHGG